MEALKKESFFARLYLKKPQPFVEKRDVDWKKLGWSAGIGMLVLIFGLLLMPGKSAKVSNFHEKAASATASAPPVTDSTTDGLAQAQKANSGPRFFGGTGDVSPRSGGSQGGSNNRNAPMIIARSGADGRTSLPPGSRLDVRLIEKVIVSSQPVPVIGILQKDVIQEDSVAIPQGAKVFGEASFDDNSERAQVTWKTIRYPDGRERQLSAISISQDGQAGIEGNVHSDAVKNTVGQTITRFVAAYADGSMQRGAFGSNPGGDDNGLKNAIAQTAKDRADAWGQGLQKQKTWIELSAGTSCIAVLSASFQFVDPGALYGR